MKTTATVIAVALALGACFAPGVASALDSGSSGADGPFSPTVNTTVTLPPSGIFNYTTVNIPAGVTVSYVRNTANTPVVILASGNVTIAGTLNVSGSASPGVLAGGDGSTADDGQPGLGGPGGFDGGRGGSGGANARGGDGLGSGGGVAGTFATGSCVGNTLPGGSGAGFGGAGANITCGTSPAIPGGSTYGSSQLLPLIGGSGGGGGSGGPTSAGSGGGGGGGAILIASSGTVNVTGAILALGGGSGASPTQGGGIVGGGGSGGAIRVVATTLSGNGTIQATAGAAGAQPATTGGFFVARGTDGGTGRIHLEADSFLRTAAANPVSPPPATPGPVFVAGAPTLTISSVAGVSAPVNPTGNADITLAANTPNPVTVVFTTSGVPVGNIVQLTVIPAFAPRITAVTPALTGSTASATASVSVNLPIGSNVLQAQTTFTVVAALGDLLRNFAGNERVGKITLSATLGGKSKATLITVSGKEFDLPVEALQIAAMGR